MGWPSKGQWTPLVGSKCGPAGRRWTGRQGKGKARLRGRGCKGGGYTRAGEKKKGKVSTRSRLDTAPDVGDIFENLPLPNGEGQER